MNRESHRSSNNRERFKYGMCLNDECSKCKSKEIQQIPMRKDFVCEECGTELRECAPPKSKSKAPLIIGCIIVAIIALGVGGYCMFKPNNAEFNTTAQIDSLEKDSVSYDTLQNDAKAVSSTATIDKTQKAVEKPRQQVPSVTRVSEEARPKENSQSKSLNLGYATYRGETKNGQPDGMGTMTYRSSHQIDSRDMQGRMAESGDYVSGEWSEGHLVQGRWYDSSNTVKGSILIGR